MISYENSFFRITEKKDGLIITRKQFMASFILFSVALPDTIGLYEPEPWSYDADQRVVMITNPKWYDEPPDYDMAYLFNGSAAEFMRQYYESGIIVLRPMFTKRGSDETSNASTNE